MARVSVSVIDREDIERLRQIQSLHPPSFIQGVIYILLLVSLACTLIWLSSYRNKLQHPAAVDGKFQYSPDNCPFTIRQLNKSTYLIREHDQFGEYPHIYVKKYEQTLSSGQTASVFVINDTGCGTTTATDHAQRRSWNIRNFIEHHLNPNSSDNLYLVVLSHCHYDHILGLDHILRPAKAMGETQSSQTLIMSSNYDRSFIEPRSQLRKHSLCAGMHLHCPSYKTTMWAHHDNRVTIQHPKYDTPIHLPILTLHTPGHTPDSLTWYDEEERALYVGDSFYEQESNDSRAAPWGREAAAPILFSSEGDLVLWWQSLDVLIAFVEEKNAVEGCKRIVLSSGHVTAEVDAATCLQDVKEFMKRVLRNEVRFEEKPPKRGERFGLWSEEGGRFSLGAPVRVIEEGRLGIAKEEWQNETFGRSSCIV